MKMLGFLSLWIAASTLAQVDFPQCQPDVLEKDANYVKVSLTGDQRLAAMDRLFTEVQKLDDVDKSKEGISKPFIQNCYEKKAVAFYGHSDAAPASTQASFQYQYLLGMFEEKRRRFQKALEHYKLASQKDPSDTVSQMKAYKIWFVLASARIERIGKKNLSEKDINDYENENLSLLNPLVNNPKIPVDVKIEALNRHALVLLTFNRELDAMEDFKRVIGVDPHNVDALRRLYDFEVGRKRYPEARKYLEVLSPLQPNNLQFQRELLKLQLRDKDYDAMLSTSKMALAKHSEDSELKSMRAAALQGMGRLTEAKDLNHEVMQTKPKNQLARQTESALLESSGDKWNRENLPGKAIADYSAALNLTPDNIDLRMKMANVLYNFRRNQNFKPKEASQLDLDKVLELLDPTLNQGFTQSTVANVYIAAAANSSHPEKGAKACDQYQANLGMISTLGMLLDCVKAYRSAGKATAARELLESALNNPRFKSSVHEISGALGGVGR